MTVLCNVEGYFFTSNPLQLVPDYQYAWSTLVTQVTPYLNSGELDGFFLGDELVWNGLNYDSLVTVADLVKQSFPNALVYYNEAYPVVLSNKNAFGKQANYSQGKDLPITN